MTPDDQGRSLDAPAKIAAAQARVAATLPYLAARVYRFRPVPVPGLGTAGTDRGARLAYDPDFLAGLTVHETATVLVHELGHHVLETWTRGGSRPRRRWNKATDAEINGGIVARAGLPWPADFTPITPENIGAPAGRTAEEYDAHLAQQEEQERPQPPEPPPPDEPQQEEQDEPQDDEPGEGETETADDDEQLAEDEEGDGEQDGEEGDEQPDDPETDPDPATDGTGTGTGEGEPDPEGEEGDGAGDQDGAGRGAPGTADGPDQDDIAAALPPDAPPPVSAEEKAIDDWSTATEIQEYQEANGIGSVPGTLAVWASGHLKPKRNPWQQILKSRLRRECSLAAGHDEFSRRIARRYWGTLALLGPDAPIEHGTEAHEPRIAIVADTSCSMGDHRGTIQAEALQIARAVSSGRADFLAVDTIVQGRAKVRGSGSAEQLRDAMRGDGGTDMRVGIEEAERLGADVVVVLTDGGTPWHTRDEHRRLRVRVVVALVGAGTDPPAWYGRAVRVTE